MEMMQLVAHSHNAYKLLHKLVLLNDVFNETIKQRFMYFRLVNSRCYEVILYFNWRHKTINTNSLDLNRKL